MQYKILHAVLEKVTLHLICFTQPTSDIFISKFKLKVTVSGSNNITNTMFIDDKNYILAGKTVIGKTL